MANAELRFIPSSRGGYNATVLTYGQTGSGKTFTMGGSKEGMYMGIIPSVLRDIFEKTDDSFEVRVSFLEVTGLNEVKVTSFAEAMKVHEKGCESRACGATAMNAESSRSHAILTIRLEKTKKDDPLESCKAKFHLVDLAGSERIKRTGAEGERLREKPADRTLNLLEH